MNKEKSKSVKAPVKPGKNFSYMSGNDDLSKGYKSLGSKKESKKKK